MPYVDVLTCGNGQWGGLGNALYSNAQSTPVRAKNVSGLLECASRSAFVFPHTAVHYARCFTLLPLISIPGSSQCARAAC